MALRFWRLVLRVWSSGEVVLCFCSLALCIERLVLRVWVGAAHLEVSAVQIYTALCMERWHCASVVGTMH